MKIYKIVLSVMSALLVLSGCAKEDVLGQKNKNKERPSVSMTKGDNTKKEFHFTLNPSSDAAFYGYVVYEGKDNPVPAAYDIVTGNASKVYSAEQYMVDDTPVAAVTVKCSTSEDYQIFAASMNADGLLSEVTEMSWHIEGAEPDLVVKVGNYLLKYEAGEDVANPDTGTPFNVSIEKLSGLQYLFRADWFGAFGTMANPILVGTLDLNTGSLIFDGTFYFQNQIQDKKVWGNAFAYYDQAQTQMLAFWGGGASGTEGFNIELDKTTGEMTKLNGYFDLTIHNASDGSAVAVFDYVENATFEFKGN